MSSPKMETEIALSDDAIRSEIDDIFKSQPVKVIADQLGLTPAAVRKSRQYGAPDTLVRAIKMIACNSRLAEVITAIRAQLDQEELDRQIAAQEAEIARLRKMRGRS